MILEPIGAVALLAQGLSVVAVRMHSRATPDLSMEGIEGTEGMEAPPPVLVVIPARNEEANIGACVGAVLASAYGALRVRVVDDGSTDRTPETVREIAARDGRAELIAAPPLPPGWTGKNHALWHGTRDASADHVLFLDADLRVGPASIARAVALSRRLGADLVTVVPRVEVVGFWEQAVQALISQIVLTSLAANEVNDPSHPRAAAIGPFMLFRRESYERLGGHATVRAEVVEDLRIAEAVKRAGMRLVLARDGASSLRMYDSLRGIVRGWTKNFHVALGDNLWAAPLLAAGVLVAYAGPVVVAAAGFIMGRPWLVTLGLAAAGAFAWARLELAARYRLPAAGAYLAPLGAVVVAWIILRSAWRAARRTPNEWRGRFVR